MKTRIMTALMSLLLIAQSAQAMDRLKDIAQVQGVRSNQLVGYGLVVGLDGTGDKAPFTNQTFTNMMKQFGITIPPGTDPKLKNVAAVSIHASLPAFSKPGQEIDITVSSIGNASSLRGGSLLLTPLTGADGEVYAVAQGNLIVGGFGVEGQDGSSITVNVPVVGRIPNGATVERAVKSGFNQGDYLTFNLNNADFTTATRVAKAINDLLGDGSAYAMDAGSIRVNAPRDANQRVAFLSVLENIEVQPAVDRAKVIINSRTGTIVVGNKVAIDPVAVTHGSLTVTINENPTVSQPNALGQGNTAVVPNSQVSVQQGNGRMFMFGGTATLQDIVDAVNQVGAAPGDLVAILEAMKEAGALHAELIVI